MYTDNHLVKKVQSGDMGAFERLVQKYDRQVLNIASSFRNSEEDAKDIYQEVFLRVYKGIENFQFRSEFSTWLYRITTNVCITYKSKKDRSYTDSLDRSIKMDEENTTKLSDTIAGGEDSSLLAENEEISVHLKSAIESLPPKQKMAFTLKYYQGLKIKEIAVMMNCQEGTIKRYIFSANNKMKEKLGPLLG